MKQQKLVITLPGKRLSQLSLPPPPGVRVKDPFILSPELVETVSLAASAEPLSLGPALWAAGSVPEDAGARPLQSCLVLGAAALVI